MKTIICAILSFLAVCGLSRDLMAEARSASKPRIEVCFVLDSTGSMGGLIEGAKQKIWSIANQMISAKPAPDIKIGLISYRDRGDQYITKVFDLSADIDTVYSNLRQFHANGGGDGPESVNQALNEAVNKMSWSKDKNVLKLVFLVGDAPPHMDYKDDVKYADTCQEAVRRDLVINTVQCGSSSDTAVVWKDIADRSEGKFVAISQTGDMQIPTTPMDAELAALNARIGGTSLAYGSETRQRRFAEKSAGIMAMRAPAAADRMLFMKESLGAASASAEGDLVSDLEAGKVTLGSVKEEELPQELKGKDAKEREAIVQAKVAERKEVEAKISDLLKKRSDYIAAEQAKLARQGKSNSFDAQVFEIVKSQAAKKGMVYQ